MPLTLNRKILVWLLLIASLVPYNLKQSVIGDPGASEGAAIKISYIVVEAILLIVLFNAIRSMRNRRLIKQAIRGNRFVIYYCIWLVVGQLIGVLSGAGMGISDLTYASAYALSAFAGFYAIPALMRQRDILFLFRAILVIGTAVAFLGAFASVTQASSLFGIPLRPKTYIPWLGLYESAGPFHELNIFGFTVAMSIWVASYFARRAYQTGRYFSLVRNILIITLCAFALLVSWSRAMYLAMGVGILIALSPTKKRVLAYSGIVALLAAMIYTVYMLFQTEFGVSFMQLSGGLGGRQIFWPAAIKAIIHQPLFGYGFAVGANRDVVFSFGGYLWADFAMGPANSFLDLSVRGGLLLGVLYIATLYRSWRRLSNKSCLLLAKNDLDIILLRRTLLGIIVTAFIGANFIIYSLGGIGYASLVFTIIFGICNMWPEYWKEHLRTQQTPDAG